MVEEYSKRFEHYTIHQNVQKDVARPVNWCTSLYKTVQVQVQVVLSASGVVPGGQRHCECAST